MLFIHRPLKSNVPTNYNQYIYSASANWQLIIKRNDGLFDDHISNYH